ncbi:MAG: hypothetical protein HYW63_00705 [Candidatus Levybacteria bacterium]|nr:hypothetical protein [Candidatus Levybacteria bacterium]
MTTEVGSNPRSVPPEVLSPAVFPKPDVLISPLREEGHIDFQPFNPRTVSREVFQQVPGSVQEFALKYLYRGKIEAETASLDEDFEPEQQFRLAEQAQLAKEAIARLRPDFEMDEPLSDYEIRLTDAIDRITQRNEPIQPMPGDDLFNFIKIFIPRPRPVKISEESYDQERYGNSLQAGEAELARILEDERLRREEFRRQGSDYEFYSWEPIGGYKAGRRYRRLLERQVALEIENERKAAANRAIDTTGKVQVSVVPAVDDRVAEIRAELTVLQGSHAA